jgi:hypothetical protein
VQVAVVARAVDVMTVLVDERVRVDDAFARGDDDRAPAVTAPCFGPAPRREFLERDDLDGDARDLVPVHGVAEEVGVPVDVDVVGAHVEADRPALLVLAKDDRRLRACSGDEPDEQRDEDDGDAHCRRWYGVRAVAGGKGSVYSVRRTGRGHRN